MNATETPRGGDQTLGPMVGDRHGGPLTTTAKFPRGYRQDQDRHSRAFANAWPPIGQAREPNSVDKLWGPIAPLEPDRRLP